MTATRRGAQMYSSSSSSSSSSVVLLLLAFLTHGCRCDWDEWWTYDGISGSAYWGVVNPGWSLCSRGRSQSPVDVDPRRLVFDRTLGPLSVGKRPVAGVVANTGQSLTFRVTEDGSAAEDEGRPQLAGAVIAGGPLAYRYRFESLYVHWGPDDLDSFPVRPGGLDGMQRRDFSGGSEHSVAGRFFPAEVQLMAFNEELFSNLSEALGRPHGVAAVAVMVQEHHREVNPAFRTIAQHLRKVTYRGQVSPLQSLTLSELMPTTEGYMTYEGSSTRPGCEEGVTWVIMNRPIYASRLEMAQLRALRQGEDDDNPKSPVGAPNARPAQELGGRTVRTNVATSAPGGGGRSGGQEEPGGARGGRRKGGKKGRCPDIAREVTYRPNKAWWDGH